MCCPRAVSLRLFFVTMQTGHTVFFNIFREIMNEINFLMYTSKGKGVVCRVHACTYTRRVCFAGCEIVC